MSSRLLRPILPLIVLLLAFPAAAEESPRRDRRVASEPWFGFSGGSVRARGDRRPERLLALTGLKGALVTTEAIDWGRIQPTKAARGQPSTLDFRRVDEVVLLWQLAGFQPVPVLTPRAPFASVPAAETPWARHVERELGAEAVPSALRVDRGVAPPREAYWRPWEQFVEAFVERYDGDGVKDMPGLRRPVRYIQILERVGDPGDFLGAPADYLRLLHHAGVGARRANGQTQIVHAAVDLMALGYTPVPQPDVLKQRMLRVVPQEPQDARLRAKWEIDFWQRTLDMPSLYEVLALQGSSNHDDDIANIGWARHQLDEAGDPVCRIWLTGVPPEHLEPPRVPTAPRMDRRLRADLVRWRAAAHRPRHSDHVLRKTWLQRGHAYDLVRATMLARFAGADAVLVDPDPKQVREASVEGAASTSVFDSLVDDRPGGEVTPTPLGHALLQLVRRMKGQGHMERISVGSFAHAFVVQLPTQVDGSWCAILMQDPHKNWAGDGRGGGHKHAISLPVPGGRYVVEPIQTAAAEGPPVIRESLGGLLNIQLGAAPVYVYPAP